MFIVTTKVVLVFIKYYNYLFNWQLILLFVNCAFFLAYTKKLSAKYNFFTNRQTKYPLIRDWIISIGNRVNASVIEDLYYK